MTEFYYLQVLTSCVLGTLALMSSSHSVLKSCVCSFQASSPIPPSALSSYDYFKLPSPHLRLHVHHCYLLIPAASLEPLTLPGVPEFSISNSLVNNDRCRIS